MEYFVTANGTTLHVSDSEKGEKSLLFLHGYLETLYIWEDFRELIPESFRFISLDLPGHGLSGSHPTSNDMSFVADVLADLMNKKSLKDVAVIGHSMGGYIGQMCIKKYPEIFTSLIHFNSNPFADSPLKRESRLKEIEVIENGKLMTLAQLSIPNMYAKGNLRRLDFKVQETIEICETHDPFGISASLRGLMSREDNVEFLKSTKTPILFVFGDSDNFMDIESANNILSLIPNAKGVIIPSTGHNSFIEEPEKCAQALIDFISQK